MFKNLTRKQLIALIVSLSLILALSVGVTLAYIFINTDPVTNIFDPAQVSCAVVENGSNTEHYGDQVTVSSKSNVMIKNTGDTDAYIRAAVVITWKSTDGKVYAQAPSAGDYTINYATDTGWELGADGFYYYLKDVAPVTECTHATNEACEKCCTGVLINSCSQEADATVPAGYHLSVEIVASAIQSKPDHVVGDEWKNARVTVTGNNGSLTITNIGG